MSISSMQRTALRATADVERSTTDWRLRRPVATDLRSKMTRCKAAVVIRGISR